MNALNTFPEEKEIVRSEQSGKRGYSTFSYISGRFIAEVPLQIVITGILISLHFSIHNYSQFITLFMNFNL